MKTKQPATTLASAWQNPEEFVRQTVTKVREDVEMSVKDVTAYAQLYPEKALLWAAGGGYLLRMLPLAGILAGLIRVVLMLLKPAGLFYGAAKIWQKAQPVLASRKPSSGS